MAWSTKDLEPLFIGTELQSKLNLQGKLLELTIIGESNHVLLTQMKDNCINYRIYNIHRGNIVFYYDNTLDRQPQVIDKNLYCVGLLFHRKIETKMDLKDDGESSSDLSAGNFDSDCLSPVQDERNDSDSDDNNPIN